ncbi:MULTISPECIES: LysR family transcriptional regulator [unclassified Leclercia]|uniref:LysR family transcriptional regulator n=1 Tax=unclassified Leclercia TaxID=2627398 RepID=UPI001BA525FE|nr:MULTISPECIES: LysR family transcriptional regulator [unclassified Leclercia]MBM6604981.1 LysR family transcriptional regulator [Enterobacteriaceae bacterium RIT 814]MBS0850570.1 LysR family transcriptional regulator [Enterobacter sp. JGM127]
MDLHQLRCFVVLAEELHFGRAARRLNMTQPPFSRQIQLLEKSLGGALFERDNRHVRLTFLGEQLLGRANQLLQQAEQFTFTAQSCLNGESGTLSIGFTAVFSWAFIPALLKNLHAALPGLNIQLHENVSNKQIIAIENESIDVGFVRKVPLNPSLDYLPLKSEALVGAFHIDHELARKRKIQLSAFAGQPFFLYSPDEARYFFDRITDLFAFHNIVPDYKYQLAQTHTILGLVNAGLGCAIVPASARTLGFPNVTYMALDDVDIQAHNFLVYSRVNTNPVLPVFLRLLTQWIGDESLG